MKAIIYKNLVSLWAFFFSSMFLINACKSEPPIAKETQQIGGFPVHAAETVIPLFSENAGHTGPRMAITVDVPDLSGPLKELVRDLLYDGMEPEAYVKELVGFYENDYLRMKEVLEEYPDMSEGSLHWGYRETISTEFPATRIMVISRTKEYYLGGAHGMGEKQYFVINTERKKRLLLEDIVKAGSRSRIQRYIEEELRIFSEIAPDAPLSVGGFFEDQAEPPANFFLTADGLGFHWDPYEIAPYVMGPIEVLIPYKRIRGMLTL
ncbi:MAG: RsiV family protein [Treponema sp.]|nr:RsiV family protein [Treponema sp.]